VPEPKDRFVGARELLAALRAVIEPRATTEAGELDVLALYAEGKNAAVAAVADIATRVGMTVAISAPDSFLAVIPRKQANTLDLSQLRTDLSKLSESARIALGTTRATIDAHVVDGPALDVEGWAPYPLPDGLWVALGL